MEWPSPEQLHRLVGRLVHSPTRVPTSSNATKPSSSTTGTVLACQSQGLEQCCTWSIRIVDDVRRWRTNVSVVSSVCGGSTKASASAGTTTTNKFIVIHEQQRHRHHRHQQREWSVPEPPSPPPLSSSSAAAVAGQPTTNLPVPSASSPLFWRCCCWWWCLFVIDVSRTGGCVKCYVN